MDNLNIQMLKKKFIAIILARGGSKGIKNKNLYKINNRPLLYWSIKDCILSKNINETWISSDSKKKILDFSKKNKINFIKRPSKFATSHSSSESAWLHAIKYLERRKKNFDYVVAIQATSPIRGNYDLDKAIKFFLKGKYDCLFSSSKISDHFIWKQNKKILKPTFDHKKRKPRQQIEEKFHENGSFYIFNKGKFKINKRRFFGKIGTLLKKNMKAFSLMIWKMHLL